MTRYLLPIAALALALPASAQEAETDIAIPELTLEQQTSLRCGVAFATVDAGQKQGEERALVYPVMAERGREFFVRFGAKLMEDERFTREVFEALVQRETRKVVDEGLDALDEIMPPCLSLLDASGI